MSDIDERLERYLAGEMSMEERIAFEDDVLAHPEVAERLYADLNVQVAIETAARARRERAVQSSVAVPWWRGSWMRWLAPVAATAAVLLAVFIWPFQTPETPVFRGGDQSIAALEPAGDVAEAPTRFVWRASGAPQVRLELYDARSQRVFTTVTADTAVTVDPSLVPVSGYWILTPLNDLGVSSGPSTVTSYKIAD